MMERIKLGERVYLTALQSDKFKTGCFSIHFLRPLRRPEAAQNALIPSVLLGGSTSCPDIRSISIRLDELYGSSVGALVRKKGEMQAVGLYADYVEDALVGEPVFEPLVAFVGELLFSPLTENGGFRREIFENERTNLINTIRAAINNKQRYANLQMLKAMFPDEPYGIPAHGEEADLKDLDPKQLYEQYQRLLQQSQLELFYLGRVAPQAAADQFRRMLAPLPEGRALPVKMNTQQGVCQQKQLEQSLPLAQSKLAIGCRCRAARSVESLAQMLCFAVLYGGGASSKLFLNVREAKSLCYYANAAYDKYQGVLLINSGIARENYAAACAEIYQQLRDCAEGRFTAAELAAAKRLICSQLRSDLDNPGRLDEFYLGQAVLNAEYGIEDLLREVALVDAEAVRLAAAEVRADTEFFLKGVGE